MRKWWIRTNWFLTMGCGWLLALMMMLTAIDVVARVLFNHPFAGVNEILTLLLPIALFLGLAYTEIAETHVSVDLIVGRFSEKGQAVASLVNSLLVLILFGLIAWQGWITGMDSAGNDEVLPGLMDFPVYPTKLILALGFTLCTIQVIIKGGNTAMKLFGVKSG